MKRFFSQSSGSVATLAGLLIPVTLVSALASVDYTRSMEAKQLVQNALDAAVLSCAATEGKCTNDLFFENITAVSSDLAEPPQVSISADENGGYTGTAHIRLNSVIGDLSALLGAEESWFSHISATASAVQEKRPAYSEAVFVVDVSSSLGGALSDLRDSSSALAGKLFDNDVANISVIPFGSSVRFPTDKGFEQYLATPTCEPAERCNNPNVWNGCFAPESFEDLGRETPLPYKSLNWNGDKISHVGNPFCPGPKSESVFFSTSKSDVMSRLRGLSMSHGTGTDNALAWARRALFEDFMEPFRNGTPAADGRRVVVLFSDGLANTTGDIDAVRGKDRKKAIEATETNCKLLRDNPEIDFYVVYVYGKATKQQALGISSMTKCAGSESRLFHGSIENEIPNLFDALGRELLSKNVRLTT